MAAQSPPASPLYQRHLDPAATATTTTTTSFVLSPSSLPEIPHHHQHHQHAPLSPAPALEEESLSDMELGEGDSGVHHSLVPLTPTTSRGRASARRRYTHRDNSPSPPPTSQLLFGITPWNPPKKSKTPFDQEPTTIQQRPGSRSSLNAGDPQTLFSVPPGSPATEPVVDESIAPGTGRFGINLRVQKGPGGTSRSHEGFALTLERIGNWVWVGLFGWWLALGYMILALLLACTVVGIPYANYARKMALYYLWPFGKYVVRLITEEETGEKLSLLQTSARARFFQANVDAGLPNWKLYVRSSLWLVLASIIIVPLHVIAFSACWMLVVLIPMAKINIEAIDLLYKQPLTIDVYTTYPGPSANIIFCTYQAINRYYYKYSIHGLNIVLVNLLPFVALCLVLGYVLDWVGIEASPSSLFIVSLISVIPTSYLMGMAVSSLAAQTSFAIGALLNATFGSFIELMIYFNSIRRGTLNDLVQASVIGTLLAMMLFLPGVSMVAGGLRYKEQRFNPASAGVSSVLLLISVIGAFTPTIFYSAFGSYVLDCTGCLSTNTTNLSCSQCTWRQGELDLDPAYYNATKPLMYTCAAILPIGYIIGLIFTLRTHSHIFEEERKLEEEHEAPAWGKWVSGIVLLLSTLVFALVSEVLVDAIGPVLTAAGIRQTFAGLTLIALIASIGEFANAVQFAVNNNMALSIEIALSASVQVVLIQFPVLILFSALLSECPGGSGSASGSDSGSLQHSSASTTCEPSFTLIFPTLDLFAVIFSVTILNYITFDGKANYFQGAALIIIYALLVAAFWFVPNS